MDEWLLRKVRSEIQENVHFTPKETDIYKIHQSGDLANLDGLDDAALSKLPSLLKLRDALYSPAFRKYVATVTNSGELSGRKTDMAINVYTPGCHLLCHDDVIGSRRVSYILYLTDPDVAWQEEWGGALRLYPTITIKDEENEGRITKTPSPDFSKSIPPAWNQLSFFAVQPGESFHDVEEVYHAANKEQLEKDGGRIRMAISGWYHIPQIGEDGYVEGAEEKLAEKSSLVQLQGKADRFDHPREQSRAIADDENSGHGTILEAADIEFLLKYMAPTYLVPDTVERINEYFADNSSITLDDLLSVKFSARLREYIEKEEASTLPFTSEEIEKGSWKVARPPHKHRFLYLEQTQTSDDSANGHSAEISPLKELVDVFLPSPQFRKWLEIATECKIEEDYILGRRFRRGLDYALATSHEGKPRIEVCLGLTPTPDQGSDDPDGAEPGEHDKGDGNDTTSPLKGKGKGKMEHEDNGQNENTNGSSSKGKGKAKMEEDAEQTSRNGPKANSKAKAMPKTNGASKLRNEYVPEADSEEEEDDDDEREDKEGEEEDDSGEETPDSDDPGGHEVYMAADDDDADAAIYKTDPNDDNVLFTAPPSWNTLSIVLRDTNILKFVKYLSRAATSDRWDVTGIYGIREEEDDEEDGEGGDEGGEGSGEKTKGTQVSLESSDEEEEFKGFPESEDSDSD